MNTSLTQWPSRTVFILAAIGSAAGLGNLWRFPYLAFEYGGGAFIVAVVVANLVIGIPLLILELGLGQKTGKGAPDALSTINKSFRYLGWSAVAIGFLIVSYYMVVVAWGMNYLVSSFTLAWGDDPQSYFFTTVLQSSDTPGVIGGVSMPVLLALIVSWVIVYFTIWKGVASVSRVVKWSATLPFVILAILVVRAVSLPGAATGLSAYLLPQWGALLDAGLWLAAFSQVFFSLSLASGVMIAYGAYNDNRAEIVVSSLWIAFGNFAVSFLSGLVVFGTLGFMADTEGVTLAEVAASGPALVFVVFPQILNVLPAFSTIFAVIFFVMLLALAVDSAFSLLEALSKSIKDRLPGASTERIAFGLGFVGLLAGVLFTTTGGLYMLDTLDHVMVNYGLVTIGLLQAVAVGWIWKSREFLRYLQDHSRLPVIRLWYVLIRLVVPVFLAGLLLWNLFNEFRAPYEGYPAGLLFWFGLVPVLLVALSGPIFDLIFKNRKG